MRLASKQKHREKKKGARPVITGMEGGLVFYLMCYAKAGWLRRDDVDVELNSKGRGIENCFGRFLKRKKKKKRWELKSSVILHNLILK